MKAAKRWCLWSGSLVAVVLAASLPAVAESAEESHPFNAHDLVTLNRLSDPQVSPDGKQVAFTLRTTDLDENKGLYDVWAVATEGGEPRRLTTDVGADNHPRWAPDGKALYFLSSRSGSSQVWKTNLDEQDCVQVTDLPLDVGVFAVSPDGTLLAVSLEVFVDCEDLPCTVKRLEEREKSKSTGRLYERMFIRHWDTWKDGRRSQIFTVPVKGGDPSWITRGLDADVPSKPFGGAEELAFTTDGKGLVFTARDAGPSEPWSTNFDLYLAPVDASAEPRVLTEENKAWDTQPLFSPDGKILAYFAMSRPGFEADRFRIVLRAWPEGETRVLTEAWDRSPSGMVFSPDGKKLFVIADDVGQVALFSVDVETGDVTVLLRDGRIRSPGVTPDGGIVFGRDGMEAPVDLFVIRPGSQEARQLTDVNREALDSIRMGEPEQFAFAGWNDETVHGYVVKPVDFDPEKKYPVAFLIHGGPQGGFGNDFHYRWNPQTYVGAGYAAVMIDFHGSVGYGQAFTDSITGDWGGKPLEDLQKGLAAALEAYPWLDGDQVCGLGASYGGYMVNWIAGNWPDRFRCLVNHDGNLDERLAYYDTEELWFPEWEHGGTPWENPDGFEKHNPVNFVSNWKTPMLVIHGALDYRVVETQGMSTFTALQRKGIPSQFLYFPDENHWVLKPHNSLQWHDTVLAWMDRWLKDEE